MIQWWSLHFTFHICSILDSLPPPLPHSVSHLTVSICPTFTHGDHCLHYMPRCTSFSPLPQHLHPSHIVPPLHMEDTGSILRYTLSPVWPPTIPHSPICYRNHTFHASSHAYLHVSYLVGQTCYIQAVPVPRHTMPLSRHTFADHSRHTHFPFFLHTIPLHTFTALHHVFIVCYSFWAFLSVEEEEFCTTHFYISISSTIVVTTMICYTSSPLWAIQIHLHLGHCTHQHRNISNTFLTNSMPSPSRARHPSLFLTIHKTPDTLPVYIL